MSDHGELGERRQVRRTVQASFMALMTSTTLPVSALAQAVIDGGATETVFGTGGGTQPNTWNIGDTLTVGNLGLGTLIISDGGVVSNTLAILGATPTGNGKTVITGATSQWLNSSTLYVGSQGVGTLNITDATVEAAAILIAQGNDTQGTVSLTGPTAQLNANSANMIVGFSGLGTLEASTGASVFAGADLLIGYSAGGGGSFATLDNATLTVTDDTRVGRIESGALNIQNGATFLSNGFVTIGEGGGSGTLTVSGASSNWTLGADTYVGTGGIGQITLSDGAAVLGNHSNLYLGSHDSLGLGTLIIDNAGWTDAGEITLGADVGASGTLTLSSGGTLSSSDYLFIGDLGDGTTLVTGADSQLTTDLGVYLGNSDGGTGLLTIADGGEVSTTDVKVGARQDTVGTVSVSGPDSELNADGELIVGDEGRGALAITGGKVSATSTITLGYAPMGEGAVLVSGPDAGLAGDHLFVAEEGAGTLTIAADGTVTVANRAYLGFNATSEGTLSIGAAAGEAAVAPGNLDAPELWFGDHEDAKLFFNHTGSAHEFAVDMIGEGRLYQLAGETVLTGDSSGFTGVSQVSGGALLVNGSLGGNVVSLNGGIVGGTGTLTGLAITASGGRLAPGNSIGTLSAASVLFDPGSVYEVELADGGFTAGTHNDHLDAAGSVTINGGMVHVTPENGIDDGSTYTPGTYTIISAGSLSGSFDTSRPTDDYVFLDFTLEYDATNVYLHSEQAVFFSDIASTPNQLAVAGPLEALGRGNALYDALLGISGSEDDARAAFDDLTGEIHSSMKTALLEDSRFPREGAMNRLRDTLGGTGADGNAGAAAEADYSMFESPGLWARGFGARGQSDGDGNATALDRSIGGLLVGGDAAFLDTYLLGVFGGVSRSRYGVDMRSSSSTADGYTLGIYGGGHWGGFSLQGGVSHGWHRLETSRAVAFTGFSDQVSASYNARTLQAWGEAAYHVDAGGARLEPFANLAHVRHSTDGFSERGGSAALSVTAGSDTATLTTLGLRAETDIGLGGRWGGGWGGMNASLSGAVAWRHAFGETPTSQVSFAAGGEGVPIAGVPLARDVLVLDAGLEMTLGSAATLDFSYGGLFGSGMDDHSGTVTLNVRF